MVSTFAIAILISVAVKGIDGCGIEVQVKQGKLSGEQVTTVTGINYYSFKGIPYAKPPLKELRFKAPEPIEAWDGVRNATAHGPVCPQLDILTNMYIPGSEDCLFLNVYSPDLKPKKYLPVIVVIHGGAFKFGSGNTDLYGPDFLVSEAVVVTFNYRLDVLGFLSLGTCDVPGNAGLKDQVAVLKWVRDNISSFGGDADRVTIIGGTAGGASVAYHMISPMSKGLFQRAIAMSGAPTCDSVYSFQAVRRAFVLGLTLGHNAKDTTDLLEFLQNVDYDKLINTTVSSATVLAAEERTDIPFKMQPFTAPVVEPKCAQDSFITEDPLQALEYGSVNEVDAMFSYNSEESLILIPAYASMYIDQYLRFPELFVPSKILVHSKPDTSLEIADKIIKYYFGDKSVSVSNIAEFISYANNASIVYDMQRFFKRWPDVGNKYVFKFSSYSSRNLYGVQGKEFGIKGAAHLDDVGYIFDPKSKNFPLDMNSVEYKMVQHITTAIINFAKYGNPTPDNSLGVIWPQFDNDTLAYVNFAEDLTVEYAPDDDDYKFWRSVFNDAGMTY